MAGAEGRGTRPVTFGIYDLPPEPSAAPEYTRRERLVLDLRVDPGDGRFSVEFPKRVGAVRRLLVRQFQMLRNQ